MMNSVDTRQSFIIRMKQDLLNITKIPLLASKGKSGNHWGPISSLILLQNINLPIG